MIESLYPLAQITQKRLFCLHSLFLFIFILLIENILFYLTLQYEIVPDKVSWYFPVAFNILLYLLLPFRFWLLILLATSIGNSMAYYLFLDHEFISELTIKIESILSYIFALPALYYAKKYHLKRDWFTLDAIFLLLILGLFYRFSYMFLAYLAEFGIYNEIAREHLFEYFVAHFLAGTLTYFYLLAGTLLFLWVKKQKAHPSFNELSYIVLKVLAILLLCFIVYKIQPALFPFIQAFSFIPLLWFGYRYGFFGIVFSVFVAMTVTLLFLFKQEGAILLQFQPFMISAMLVAFLIGAVSLENGQTEKGILQQKNQLIRANTELQNKNQKLQELSRSILDIQEQERKLLSQEINDELTRGVSELQVSTNALLSIATTEKTKVNVSMIKQSIAQIYNSIFESMHWLRPSVLDQHGIYSTLTAGYFAKRLTQVGISYKADIVGEKILLSEMNEITLFRLVQEAITNTIKHAKATRLVVKLMIHTDHIELYVADNGVGMSSSSVSDAIDYLSGFGLKGLKSRVLALEGTLEVITDISAIDVFTNDDLVGVESNDRDSGYTELNQGAFPIFKHSVFCLKATLPL